MKTYNISQLKAHLSQAIAAVRQGNVVAVLNRKTPVAHLVPIKEKENPLNIRPSSKKSRKKSLYSGISLQEDIQTILQQDRGRR